MSLNLNQITIQVSDMEKSIAFYQLLGLRLIVKSNPHYARFECMAGDATFSLHKNTEEKPCNTWIYFETETLDEDVQRLKASGIEFDELPKDQPWLWREAKLKDPDGNQLILYFAGDNRKNPPWRLKE